MRSSVSCYSWRENARISFMMNSIGDITLFTIIFNGDEMFWSVNTWQRWDRQKLKKKMVFFFVKKTQVLTCSSAWFLVKNKFERINGTYFLFLKQSTFLKVKMSFFSLLVSFHLDIVQKVHRWIKYLSMNGTCHVLQYPSRKTWKNESSLGINIPKQFTQELDQIRTMIDLDELYRMSYFIC